MNPRLRMRFGLKLHCTCNGCGDKVKKLRQSIQGVDSIAIDEKRGIATISGTVDPDTVMKELAKVKVKNTVLLWDESEPVTTNKQVQESCHKKHQAGLDESTRKRTLNCCQKSGHKLELKPKSKRFTCIGCKEEGFGPRYRCDRCDYDFHKECKSPKETTTHELFKGSTFEFLSKSDKKTYTCDECGRKIYRCSYHCEADNLDMHPCCSNLKGKLYIGDTDFILTDKVKYTCLWCKKRRPDWIGETGVPGWSYVSEQNEFYCRVLHTENGFRSLEERRFP